MEITREKLYHMVWSEPMRVLAARHGVSDRGLAKMCERLEVPRPGRGYWAKKAAGHKVRKEPLKPASKGARRSAGIVARRGRSEGRVEPEGPVADQRRFEAREENAIRVPEKVGRYHPTVRQTREVFRIARREPRVLWQRKDYLDIAVDRKSEPRALRIFNTLIKALQRRGMTVHLEGGGETNETSVQVGEVRIQIRLEERYRQQDLPISDWDRRRAEIYEWSEPRPSQELVPTGQLALKILEGQATDLRKTWADGKRQRVDDCLNSFVVGLVAAEARKEAEKRWAEWRRQREEAQRLAAIQRRREEEEKRRVRRFQQQVEDWHQAERIRRFLRAARRAHVGGGSALTDADFRNWLEWGQGHADRLDPLSKHGWWNAGSRSPLSPLGAIVS